jgi:hypothetical protein
MMGRQRRRRQAAGAGQALLELALALPVLLMLVGAGLDFGLAVYARSQVEAAVREGARLGAVLWQDPTADRQVRERALAEVGRPPRAQLGEVQVSYPDGRVRGGRIQVALSCSYVPALPPLAVAARSVPCGGTATMRLE